MSTINNPVKDLYAIDAVQDLSHESAAAIQGGTTIEVYTNPNFKGDKRTNGSPDLSKVSGFNDSISSIRNNSQKPWVFYQDANFKGRSVRLEPGQSINAKGLRNAYLNNEISSFKSVSA